MIIKKVFNNNVVFARDNSGQEVILMGKGIGFNKFTKDLVEIDKIEKKFIFNNEESLSELHSLLDRIPLKDVELVSEIIQMGREELGDNLNDSILITLSEHISYMLKRMDEGLVFQSPLQWEIRQIYPNEYNFSKKAVEYLRKKLDKNIPDSEIAFITIHFANAQLETKDMQETLLLTKIIDNVLDIIKYHYGIEINEYSFDYTRFISHLRCFIKRQLSGESTNVDTSLLDIIKMKYKSDYNCAKKVKNFLEKTYKWKISENELLYLTLHLNRLSNIK
ncbi:TPA: PRD domain-containing protein [Clostridioides difficile]|uniref:PRD domain-containing protein n=1 Tax=Clostridioides difficile TaxID=1496 RepID=UPI000428DE62|nr:PRD domain-containing protein [Clostridioides difficile]AXU29175.1 transcription antiterminator [Clostridioides difficile]AXU32963.1 transcription antiterminator [Clostridioides difficile]AXU36751.1 transcription antiterminator [Clostridioides difficile]MBY1132312.1 PRD domain-containing protein [Clostridioides difficile]MBY1883480.1 PRD domain-containing protein [Clostridioides difficile]